MRWISGRSRRCRERDHAIVAAGSRFTASWNLRSIRATYSSIPGNFKHPWKRTRTAFQHLAVAVFGKEDRAAYREAVDAAHRQVRPSSVSSVSYNAFDRYPQMWVAACLFAWLEDTYQLLQREMYVARAL